MALVGTRVRPFVRQGEFLSLLKQEGAANFLESVRAKFGEDPFYALLR